MKEYGSAAKVHGLFGVRVFELNHPSSIDDNLSISQDEQLYVSDPRAMHHILIKDQNLFEEMPATLAYDVANLWYDD